MGDNMATKKDRLEKSVSQDIAGRPNWEEIGKGTVAVTTRLKPGDRDRLEEHFRARGLKLSQGVRMILSEYMREHRI